jgi:prophage DNA circulation protein
MAWRDNLTWAEASDQLRKKASFRGALFFVRDSDTGVGRRNVVHTYPFKDEPYVEDLGADIDEFNLTGYVVQNKENQNDYFAERDALIDALKASGPGVLIHPFLGEKTVALVGKAQISESFTQGGIARFTFTFVLVHDFVGPPYPKKIEDYQQAVDDEVESVVGFAQDTFARNYEALTAFGDAVMDDVESLNDMMRLAIQSVRNLGPGAISNAIAELVEEYTNIDLTLINQSCALGNSLIGMFNGLLSLSGMYGDIVVDYLFGACSSAVRGISQGPMSGAKVGMPTSGFKASTMAASAKIDEVQGKSIVRAALALAKYGEVVGSDDASEYGGSLAPIPITTAIRAQQSANRIAMVNLVRSMAISTATRAAIRVDYSSYDSAIAVLNEVADVIDVQLIKLGDDVAIEDYATYNISVADPDGYQALQELRSTFVKSMIGVGASLARIIEFTVPAGVLPSLVLAYDKYEDLDREEEIIRRNIPIVQHPGFLPGGQDLELLNE